MGKREERAGLKASNTRRTSDDAEGGDDRAKKKRRRGQVSDRVVQKRRLEFERRSAGKGETEAVPNKAWAQYYDGLVGTEERQRIQVALAKEEPRFFLCSVLPKVSMGFAFILKRKLEKICESKYGDWTYVIKAEKLRDVSASDLRNTLQREARLGRCLLKQHSGTLFAMQEFTNSVSKDKPLVCLEIDPDADSLQWCMNMSANTVCCLALAPHHHGKRVPLFDLPNTIWSVYDYSKVNTGMFDRVLCRVPSSNDGAFRDRPSGWRTWKTGLGRDLAALQLRIAVSAAESLKKNGEMIYFTRSLNVLENECVITSLLKSLKNAGLELVELKDRHGFRVGLTEFISDGVLGDAVDIESLRKVSSFCLRAHPHDDRANDEGFFYCKLRRTTDRPLEWRSVSGEEALSRSNDSLAKLGLNPYIVKDEDLDLMKGLKKHPQVLEENLGFDASNVRTEYLTAVADSDRIVAVTEPCLNVYCELALPLIRYGILLATKSMAVAKGKTGLSRWIPEQDALWMFDAMVPVSNESIRIRYDGELAAESMRMALTDGKVDVTLDGSVKLLTLDLSSSSSTSTAAGEEEGEPSEKKARLSKAARKQLKKDPSKAKALSAGSSGIQRKCLLLVGKGELRPKDEDEEEKEQDGAFVLNNEDWTKSCGELMFSSL